MAEIDEDNFGALVCKVARDHQIRVFHVSVAPPAGVDVLGMNVSAGASACMNAHH